MKQCAFLTLDEPGDFVIDDERAVNPLAELGWQVTTLSWRQTSLPWHGFDLVVIRSTWDYWDDVAGFMEVLARIDRETRLANPLGLVGWNVSKNYLLDLEREGVNVVPGLWLNGLAHSSPDDCAVRLGARECVVKPVIGANGVDAFRFSCKEDPVRWAEIVGRYPGGRACIVQPFMDSVLTEGEYSLFFFNGAFSHAILKIPAAGEFRSQEERGAEIRSAAPDKKLLSAGEGTVGAVSPTPLYARVDLVRDVVGDFALMELELIEPSLYLRMDPAAPRRFARALDSWYAGDS